MYKKLRKTCDMSARCAIVCRICRFWYIPRVTLLINLLGQSGTTSSSYSFSLINFKKFALVQIQNTSTNVQKTLCWAIPTLHYF